mgnify:CR=1 FL=1
MFKKELEQMALEQGPSYFNMIVEKFERLNEDEQIEYMSLHNAREALYGITNHDIFVDSRGLRIIIVQQMEVLLKDVLVDVKDDVSEWSSRQVQSIIDSLKEGSND